MSENIKVKETIKTCYLIELSNKQSIPIDPDELPKVLQGIKTGNPVIVRQGIFNPSFFVDIVSDRKRILEVEEWNKTMDWQIRQGMSEPAKLEPLHDIFAEVKDKYLLQAPKYEKQ